MTVVEAADLLTGSCLGHNGAMEWDDFIPSANEAGSLLRRPRVDGVRRNR